MSSKERPIFAARETMRRLIGVLSFMLFSLSGESLADAATLFECQITSGRVAWEDMSLPPLTAKEIEPFATMTIDLDKGAVRIGKGQEAEAWEVVRRGTDSSDWVLTRRSENETGAADIDVLRLRDWHNIWWNGEPMVIYHTKDSISVGPCKPVK